MKPYYQDDYVTLYHGDCIEAMRSMPDSSIDSIVTDPPYGLGFMGKKWDSLPPGEEWARECLRVLKPGGHILAFGGTRTWHRLAVAIEDAGFEMRDSLAWLYGSGFPKNKATLKPAFEPIVMGRKPFKGSLSNNASNYGTGALSIDDCRIPHVTINGGNLADNPHLRGTKIRGSGVATQFGKEGDISNLTSIEGRWPANVLTDELIASTFEESRYFYVAKAPKSERPIVDGVSHPTVKPLTLMRHLVKLVTPTGGTALDTFAGSGTTIEAGISEGFKMVGIEQEAEYLPLIQCRVNRVTI